MKEQSDHFKGEVSKIVAFWYVVFFIGYPPNGRIFDSEITLFMIYIILNF